MINVSDILSVLKKEWVDTMRAESAQAEKQGKLTKKQLNLIYEQGWFKMLMPSVYGGKQLPLSEVMQYEEALAYADGSVGWEVTLCAGAGWFGGFLQPALAKKIFEGDKACLAGSGAQKGTAEKTASGYVISGQWPYASGTPDATCFTSTCIVTSNGKPVLDDKGAPVVRSFVFLKPEVNILNTWNPTGMIATASHSFEVKGLEVTEDRAFIINSEPQINAGIYHFPFLQLAETTLAVNLSGMALHFMELCEDILATKMENDNMGHVNKETLIATFNTLLQKLQLARQKLYYVVDMSWQVCAANKEISPSLLYKVSIASFALVNAVRDCINTLYPYCGLQATDKDSEISRVWRDIQTAGQHSLLVGDGSL